MTPIPLTSVKANHYHTFYSSDRQRTKKLHELEKTASCRQTAAKIISAICCPLTNACFIAFSPCLACSPFCCDKEDQNGTPYCYCTTCDSPCWNKALPAESRWGLIALAFDPFFYCCCFPNEGAKAFLTRPERQEMEILARNRDYVNLITEATPLPTDVANLLGTFDDPRPVEYSDRHKDAKSISVSSANNNLGIWGNLSRGGL